MLIWYKTLFEKVLGPMQKSHKTKTISKYKTKEWNENENGNPTPLQFDKFIPWLCLQMHVTTLVTVQRNSQVDFTSREIRRGSSSRSRSRDSAFASQYLDITKVKDNAYSSSSTSNSSGVDKIINIISYYNQHNQLIEVAIKDCRVAINRKVIQAINLCLPFHEFLKKFVINGEGLTKTALYEIGKLLPHSNITDVCLDDTYVPEGNYYVLLKNINQLQNISLCRCKINDEICKMLAENLNFGTPASKTLLTIDLTSNRITDLGASYLGFMLRKNRSLLYLNLSDNIIGDTGAAHILRSLMLFSLTGQEEYELKKRRFKYAADKLEEYKKCEKELRDSMKSEEDKENHHPKPEKGRIVKPIKRVHVTAFNETSLKMEAEKMAIANIGAFSDIFDNENVIYKNEKLQCIGNLMLCYLNLAYNNIKYSSIKKLCEVLKYQSSVNRSHYKGLLKVVIDGNNLPVADELLETIQIYLKIAVKKSLLLMNLNRSLSYLGKKGRKKWAHST